jgi:hypothetical protein
VDDDQQCEEMLQPGWVTLSPIAISGELATEIRQQSDKRMVKFRIKFYTFFFYLSQFVSLLASNGSCN